MAAKENNNIHKGHRQNVKQRYYETGLKGMADHNVLEMLLFFGIPYKDTNEIAHHLIERFGSFSGVLRADVEDLKKVKGMTDNAACLINMLLPIYKRYESDISRKKPSLLTIDSVIEYIRPRFIDTMNERVYVLCFDSNHHLIAERVLSEGNLMNASFDMRELASIVLETKAISVILVHNHPNSIALPSKEDAETTLRVIDFLSTLNVSVADHIIVAEKESVAMSQFPKYAPMFYGLEEDILD